VAFTMATTIQTETLTAPLINVSDRARAEISRLADSADKFLRLWVTEGGCAGMTYQASMDEIQTPFDACVFDASGVRVLADRNSVQHVDGLEIDYSDDLVNLGFRFANPNASKACGCGSSFAL
jgi:iron-sulfur cluster assembly protein